MPKSTNKPANRKGQCIFCQKWGPLTEQHVIPDQFAQLVRDELVTYTTEVGTRVRTWSSKPFTLTCYHVCEACNGGWLKRLENAVAPAITAMMYGRVCHIADSSQEAVSLWLLVVLGTLRWSRAPRNPAPREWLKQLYDSRRPPPHITCRIVGAKFGPFLGAKFYAHKLHLTDLDGIRKINGENFTFVIGHAIFKAVLIYDWGQFGLFPLRMEGVIKGFASFWPTMPGFLNWPPAATVEAEGLDAFNTMNIPGMQA